MSAATPVVWEASDVLPAQRSPLYTLSLRDLDAFAQRAARSGYFARTDTAEQALMKIAYGQARGLDPVTALSQVYVQGGVPRMHASLVGGLVKASGRYRYKVLERTTQRCALLWQERNERGEWELAGTDEETSTSAFTIEEARTAGYVKDGSGWVQRPRSMLFARALTEGALVFAGEVTLGLVSTEEYGDWPEDGREAQAPVLTPTAQAAAAAAAATSQLTPEPPAPEPAPGGEASPGAVPEPEPSADSPDQEEPAPEPEPERAEPTRPPAPTPSPSEAQPTGAFVSAGQAPGETLYDAIDRQRLAMSPEELAGFIAWCQANGLAAPTVQSVQDQWGERARDLARLMRTSELEHAGELAKAEADKAGAADFQRTVVEHMEPQPEQEPLLDDRMALMRDAWNEVGLADRNDLRELLVDLGAVADLMSATSDAVALLYPATAPTKEALVRLRNRLGDEQREKQGRLV